MTTFSYLLIIAAWQNKGQGGIYLWTWENHDRVLYSHHIQRFFHRMNPRTVYHMRTYEFTIKFYKHTLPMLRRQWSSNTESHRRTIQPNRTQKLLTGTQSSNAPSARILQTLPTPALPQWFKTGSLEELNERMGRHLDNEE